MNVLVLNPSIKPIHIYHYCSSPDCAIQWHYIVQGNNPFKDNAHNLNSPMEFNKNGYTCCLDTTKHDEIEKSRGHHAHYVTTAHYIITRFYSLFL